MPWRSRRRAAMGVAAATAVALTFAVWIHGTRAPALPNLPRSPVRTQAWLMRGGTPRLSSTAPVPATSPPTASAPEPRRPIRDMVGPARRAGRMPAP